MKSLVVTVLVVGLGTWGCSSGSDDGSTTGSGGTGTGTGGVASSGGAGSGTGGATNTNTTVTGTGGTSTATSSDPSGYDTSIDEGEFSFFTISMDFILSKKPCDSANTTGGGKTCYGGFGGDLRNGKSNGLDGADSLCTEAAQIANPGDKHLWKAFLSVADYNGAQVNAIDRVGDGPWYSSPSQVLGDSSYATDGLLVALTTTDLITNANLNNMRPNGATDIVYTDKQGSWPFNQCLLDENGVCPLSYGDDHDTLTGSDTSGKLINGGGTSNCDDWTNSTKGYGKPQIGHIWPRSLLTSSGGSLGGGGGGGGDASHWCSTTGHTGGGCAAIINVTETNYMQATQTYGGGVGSDGGYGAFYCFAYSVQ